MVVVAVAVALTSGRTSQGAKAEGSPSIATGNARSAAASPNGPFEAALLNEGGPNLLRGGAAAAIIASCSCGLEIAAAY